MAGKRRRDSLQKKDRLIDEYQLIITNSSPTGINTASKSVLLGEATEAEKYATRVEEIVGTDKCPGDYWMTATVAEVQLIRQNYDQASKLYSEAVAMTPEEIGSHKSTWQQAQLLMEKLETSSEKKAQAAKAFAHLQS
jgi:hypothetical protein